MSDQPTQSAAAVGVSGHADPEGEAPWAMQLVVRVEKGTEPDHTAVCEAAASAVALLLADPRAHDTGPWAAAVTRWTDGRIRKVVRRARGTKFEATAELDHVTVEHAGATVRAFVPGPTDRVPAQLAKLQVSGLDLTERNDTTSHPPAGKAGAAPAVTVALTPLVRLSTGKAAAQCGHAVQLAAAAMDAATHTTWVAAGAPVRLVALDEAAWAAAEQTAPVVITDAGFTEIPAGTRTSVAWWQAPPS